MSSKKRTHKMEKLARIYDDEVLPVWTQPFGRMLLRGLHVADGSQLLDVACGTGYVAIELLRRMGPKSRLIAIDGSSAMLDVARRKVEKLGAKGVFFRTESAEPRLSFTDDVYDLVVSNLGLMDMDDKPQAIADFARVARVGGQIRCTLPLAGSYGEFYDIYREVLLKHDKHEVLERLDEHLATYATVEDCEAWLEAAHLSDTRVEVEEISLLFKSSREFFFAPIIEYGPLADWKAMAGQGQEMQDIFWYIKEAIDAYFGNRAFEITVVGGCLMGTKRELTEEEKARPVKLEPRARREPTRTQITMNLDEGELMPAGEDSGVTGRVARRGSGTDTSELDLAELEVWEASEASADSSIRAAMDDDEVTGEIESNMPGELHGDLAGDSNDTELADDLRDTENPDTPEELARDKD